MVWMDLGLLTEAKLLLVDKRMEMIKMPSDTGRIARKISKSYKNMKAEEWKIFTVVYSMFVLHGILSIRDLNIWCLFVRACTYLCSRSITMQQAREAHDLLKIFCSLFEAKYGKEHCVPNMHLSLHLKDCIEDYGSVYGFWCFSFERYNGTLGRYHTSNHAISIQIMRQFVSCSKLFDDRAEFTGLEELEKDYQVTRRMVALNQKMTICGEDLEFPCCKKLSIQKKYIFTQEEFCEIESMFQKLYRSKIRLSQFATKLTRVEYLNQVIGISDYRGKDSPYSRVIARYPGDDLNDFGMMEHRPAVILKLLEVLILRSENGNEIPFSHIIAECKWLKPCLHKNLRGINNSCKIWSTQYEPSSYIPLTFVIQRYVSCKEEIEVPFISNIRSYDTVNVVIPLPSKSIV